MTIEELEQEIAAIKTRNARVDGDKAWETSRFRIYSIVVITYIIATAILFALGNDHPFSNALVPVAGYLLSTQSLSFIKKWWITKRHA